MMKTEETLATSTGSITETKLKEERNKKLILEATEEIYNKGNYKRIKEFVSDDFVMHSLNPKRQIHGVENARNFIIALRTAFPDIKFTIQDQFAEGDKVVTHFIAEGTHQDSFEGIPATGKSFKVSAIDIDYITNGKISDCWSNLDELSLLQQLGVVN